MDAKLRYKAKKLKSPFDIDDTLRAKETGIDPQNLPKKSSSVERKSESGTGIAT